MELSDLTVLCVTLVITLLSGTCLLDSVVVTTSAGQLKYRISNWRRRYMHSSRTTFIPIQLKSLLIEVNDHSSGFATQSSKGYVGMRELFFSIQIGECEKDFFNHSLIYLSASLHGLLDWAELQGGRITVDEKCEQGDAHHSTAAPARPPTTAASTPPSARRMATTNANG